MRKVKIFESLFHRHNNEKQKTNDQNTFKDIQIMFYYKNEIKTKRLSKIGGTINFGNEKNKMCSGV